MSSNIPSVTSAPINSILGAHITAPAANATPISRSPRSPTAPHRPAAALEDPKDVTTAAFVLKDGTSFQGISFGSESKSISGECVFQTGKNLVNCGEGCVAIRSRTGNEICFSFLHCHRRTCVVMFWLWCFGFGVCVFCQLDSDILLSPL